MDKKQAMFLWDLLLELRKEMVASQKLRTQFIGFKITFVAAAMGLIAKNVIPELRSGNDNVLSYRYLFLIPAYAAFFFDFLIYSYSFSIKRIGSYCRYVIEPKIKKCYFFEEENIPLWEEFLDKPYTVQNLGHLGNLGMTTITVLLAAYLVIKQNCNLISLFICMSLLVLLLIDYYLCQEPKRLETSVKKDFPAI